MKKNWNDKLSRALSLLICLLMIAVVSIRRDGKLLGHSLEKQAVTGAKTAANDTLRKGDDGAIIINTAPLAKDINGYGGAVPVEKTVKGGGASSARGVDNQENPDFCHEADQLLARWRGKSLEEAAALKVDAVSGATFSSKGIIGNMERGLQYARKSAAQKSWWEQLDLSVKSVAGLVVALMAAIVPLYYKNRRYRLFQQRSEEHTSELQSRQYLVCRLLLEKKKQPTQDRVQPTFYQHEYLPTALRGRDHKSTHLKSSLDKH